MNIQMLSGFIALIKEILRHPGVKKHNTKKNRFKNILMLCFLFMFMCFAIMTEQAVLQSSQKYALQSKIAELNQEIKSLESDLYIKHLSNGGGDDEVAAPPIEEE